VGTPPTTEQAFCRITSIDSINGNTGDATHCYLYIIPSLGTGDEGGGVLNLTAQFSGLIDYCGAEWTG